MAAGGYHESYSLAKGRSTVSRGLSPTMNQHRSTRSAARAVTRSKRPEVGLLDGLDEDPCEPTPKKRKASQLARSSFPHSKKLRTSTLSAPSTRRSKPLANRKNDLSPLPVKEICMLAYHLSGEDLKLLWQNNAFTIESARGSLVDPLSDSSFRVIGRHATCVVTSRQKSLKVILSKNTAMSVDENEDDITGGVMLLEFDDEGVRDRFISLVTKMVGYQAMRAISNVDE